MPKAALAESPGSIGRASARTPGTVVGSDGVNTGGVGPATAVGATGDFSSVHDAAARAATRTIQPWRIGANRTLNLPASALSATLKAHDFNPASRTRGDDRLAALPGRVAVGIRPGDLLR